MTEQAARHGSIIHTQPRQSIVSLMSSESPNSDVLLDMQKRRMSTRSVRRKSVIPKLDPPPGMEGLTDKGFVYVKQQMESDLRGE